VSLAAGSAAWFTGAAQKSGGLSLRAERIVAQAALRSAPHEFAGQVICTGRQPTQEFRLQRLQAGGRGDDPSIVDGYRCAQPYAARHILQKPRPARRADCCPAPAMGRALSFSGDSKR